MCRRCRFDHAFIDSNSHHIYKARDNRAPGYAREQQSKPKASCLSRQPKLTTIRGTYGLAGDGRLTALVVFGFASALASAEPLIQIAQAEQSEAHQRKVPVLPLSRKCRLPAHRSQQGKLVPTRKWRLLPPRLRRRQSRATPSLRPSRSSPRAKRRAPRRSPASPRQALRPASQAEHKRPLLRPRRPR
jgi:hypothetical protein